MGSERVSSPAGPEEEAAVVTCLNAGSNSTKVKEKGKNLVRLEGC